MMLDTLDQYRHGPYQVHVDRRIWDALVQEASLRLSERCVSGTAICQQAITQGAAYVTHFAGYSLTEVQGGPFDVRLETTE